MTENLIQHAIRFTQQRDIDMLDQCLAQVCVETFSDCELVLYKKHIQHQLNQSAIYQHFELQQDLDNNLRLQWSKDEKLDDKSEKFIECVTNNKVISNHETNRSYLLAPISYNEQNHGVIEIVSRKISDKQTENFLQLMQIYQNIYAILYDNERDQLTGLYNRKTFDKKLARLLELQSLKQKRYQESHQRSSHEHNPAWLVAIDIDHFKKVNDRFGHLYGDEVLLRLAQLMQQSFRYSDIIFRFGGEEFILILEPTDFTMTEKTLERFRKTVAEYDFPLVGHVSISIGFSAITKNDYPSQILENADKALYFAKDHGRNCIYNYEQLIEENKLQNTKLTESNEIDLF